jgi:hypothetical protein
MQLKRYRETVVYARMFHIPSGVGKGSLVKGQQVEVPLTEKALTGLYQRFVCLRKKLQQLTGRLQVKPADLTTFGKSIAIHQVINSSEIVPAFWPFSPCCC